MEKILVGLFYQNIDFIFSFCYRCYYRHFSIIILNFFGFQSKSTQFFCSITIFKLLFFLSIRIPIVLHMFFSIKLSTIFFFSIKIQVVLFFTFKISNLICSFDQNTDQNTKCFDQNTKCSNFFYFFNQNLGIIGFLSIKISTPIYFSIRLPAEQQNPQKPQTRIPTKQT